VRLSISCCCAGGLGSRLLHGQHAPFMAVTNCITPRWCNAHAKAHACKVSMQQDWHVGIVAHRPAEQASWSCQRILLQGKRGEEAACLLPE
jgi:hypothetical protein